MTDAFRILRELAQKEGITNPKSRKATRWFSDKVKELYGDTTLATKEILTETKNNKYVQKRIPGGDTAFGKMYTFVYNPMHKDKLPYYDLFPLIILIGRYNDGFLGLNLHYLAPKYRQILFDKLYPLITNNSYDHTTRFKLKYEMVRDWKKLRYAKPCIKRYKMKKIRSRVLQLSASDWNTAIYLPYERFKKKNKKGVWQDSKRNINKI
jgi:hypothetical protein